MPATKTRRTRTKWTNLATISSSIRTSSLRRLLGLWSKLFFASKTSRILISSRQESMTTRSDCGTWGLHRSKALKVQLSLPMRRKKRESLKICTTAKVRLLLGPKAAKERNSPPQENAKMTMTLPKSLPKFSLAIRKLSERSRIAKNIKFLFLVVSTSRFSFGTHTMISTSLN